MIWRVFCLEEKEVINPAVKGASGDFGNDGGAAPAMIMMPADRTLHAGGVQGGTYVQYRLDNVQCNDARRLGAADESPESQIINRLLLTADR